MTTLLIIGMIYSYGRFAFSMYEEKISSLKRNLIYASIILVASFAIIGDSLFFGNRNVLILRASEYVYFSSLIFVSSFLVFDQRISSKIADRKVIKAFGLFYSLLCIPFILHLVIPMPQSLYIYAGCQFTLMLFPIFWFRKFFLKLHTLGITYLQDKTTLNSICNEKNITKREQEIIELILQGKSNREIEKEIFISIYTVKNHIQNIYSKLGVRSRTKLIQLILDYQQKTSL
jgi:DNA-binding CsgD family transcriptional regulator